MARADDTYVPQLEQSVGVHDAPVISVNPGAFGANAEGLTQGLQSFAGAAAQTDIEQKERAAMAWSAQAVGQAHSDMLTELENQKNNAQPGAPGFAENYAKSFDAYTQKLIQNAPTLAAKQFAADRMGYLRARMVDSAQYYQENEQNEYQLTQYGQGIQSLTNAAVRDPTQLQNNMATARATYANAAMPPMIKRRLDAQVQQMPYMVMDAMTENNPEGAKALLSPSLGLSPIGGMTGNAGAGAPLGMRNNNPGNLKADGTQWEGMAGQNGGYVQFASPEAGVRAATVNLRNSILLHGRSTLQDVIGAWAPASDGNDVSAYVGDVSKRTGLAANAPLDPNNPAQMKSVVSAIFAHENGGQMPSPGSIDAGVNAAFGSKKLPNYTPPDGNYNVPTGNFNIDSIPVPQRMALYNKANAQLERSNTLFRQSVDQQMRDDMAMAAAGQDIHQPLNLNTFTRAFGDVEGPLRYKVYNNQLQIGQAQNAFYTLPNDQIQAKLDALKPQPGEGFAQEQEQYSHLQSAAMNVIQARMSDPQAYAQQYGLGPKVQLNPQDANAFTQGIRQQLLTAHTMADKYQTPFRPLSTYQASWLGAYFNSTDPNTQMQTLKGIVQATGNPDDASAILGQIKQNSPVVAKAGELLAQGDKTDTGALLLQGNKLLQQKGAVQEYVGKVSQFSQAFDQVIGNAYAGSPQTRAQDMQAVMALYAQRQAMAGKPAQEGVIDPQLMKQSVQDVIGSVANVNGSKTILPYGWTPDLFNSAMKLSWDDAMTKNGVNPEEVPFEDVTLQRLSNGEYAVMRGNGPLKNQAGAPVFVHFKGMAVQAGLNSHPAYALPTSPLAQEQPQGEGNE
jgi:hypothetical protein